MTRETKQHQKKLDDYVMPANCCILVIFPINGQFGAIRRPDSGRIVCKSYIFILQKLKAELKNL